MAESQVLSTIDAGIATFTINRPEQRNALSTEMLTALVAAFDHARQSADVHVVVLTGAGDKVFCAGADLGEFAGSATPLEKHVSRSTFVDLFLAMKNLGKPIIGAVNGHALAGGFGLALACDLIVASDSARFGTPEITVGLWPMMISAIISRNLTRKRCMELLMLGEKIDAQTALQWGLINRVVPPSDVHTTARDMALALAEKSPAIMKLGRDALYETDGMAYDAALHYLNAQLTIASVTDDAAEGVTAFLEKRPPKFTGK